MSHNVYILYSNKDAEIAMQVCEAIESNDIKCWIASRDLDAQKDTIEQMANAVESAEHVVLIFSKNALKSHEVEFAIGLSRTKDLIVLNVDGANLGPDIFLGMDKPKAVFKGTSDKFELKIPSLNVNETITKNSTSKYVYLSYDDSDLEYIASQIKQYKGMGVNFKHQIDSKIKDSSLIMVFISKDSSKSSKIREDIKSAISNDVGILLIHLDESEPDFGRMFNLKYGSKLKKAIKYSINKQEIDELTYIEKCDEIFQLFGVKK
jgi:hypothetical protein